MKLFSKKNYGTLVFTLSVFAALLVSVNPRQIYAQDTSSLELSVLSKPQTSHFNQGLTKEDIGNIFVLSAPFLNSTAIQHEYAYVNETLTFVNREYRNIANSRKIAQKNFQLSDKAEENYLIKLKLQSELLNFIDSYNTKTKEVLDLVSMKVKVLSDLFKLRLLT